MSYLSINVTFEERKHAAHYVLPSSAKDISIHKEIV
jgi:hypothetical protein